MIPTLGRGGRTEPEPAAAPARVQKILVADEALPIRRTLMEILKKLGTPESALFTASEPDEILRVFELVRPTIIFSELLGVHPEDGLEVLHEILDRDPLAKIVLITAEPRESPEVRAAIRAGVFAVVEKPLRHEKIRQVLADLESEEGGIERFR